jgi:hypothetical protein
MDSMDTMDTQALNSIKLQRLVQIMEAMPRCIDRKVVGSVPQGFRIRVPKKYYHPDHTNDVWVASLQIEVPTMSGMLFVPIAEFRACHYSKFENAVPIISTDGHWLSWQSSYKSLQDIAMVSAGAVVQKGRPRVFSLENPFEDGYDALECELFQHNVSCEPDMALDADKVLSDFSMGIDQIKRTFEKGDDLVNTCDILTGVLTIAVDNVIVIPYDEIIEALEEYVIKIKSE